MQIRPLWRFLKRFYARHKAFSYLKLNKIAKSHLRLYNTLKAFKSIQKHSKAFKSIQKDSKWENRKQKS